ncbi:MAG TPA: GNAT family N-acetyltransferase [Thermoplasmata archaeon]|nr:GNAT family N-acetyltransferase [Thermoplasmata archaeon]
MVPEHDGTGRGAVTVADLEDADRERAVPVLRDGFVGIYRWHAKRTLRDVPTVRAAELGGEVVGVSLLDRLLPEVGYVYYIAVLSPHRRRGVASLLLDDALERFRAGPVEVVYAAVREENLPSRRLFEGRGFRSVERKGTGWRDGGLGAWGLRSRMLLVHGEVLLGLRLRPPAAAPAGGRPPDGSRGPEDPSLTPGGASALGPGSRSEAGRG